jgi:Uma2 family endonuclease
MTTSMHEEVGEWIMDQIRDWTRSLQKSTDSRISSAAQTVVSSGHTSIKFPFTRGESDSKSPDLSMRHTLCRRKCRFPTIVVEIAWSQNEEDVRDKAEFYSK